MVKYLKKREIVNILLERQLIQTKKIRFYSFHPCKSHRCPKGRFLCLEMAARAARLVGEDRELACKSVKITVVDDFIVVLEMFLRDEPYLAIEEKEIRDFGKYPFPYCRNKPIVEEEGDCSMRDVRVGKNSCKVHNSFIWSQFE